MQLQLRFDPQLRKPGTFRVLDERDGVHTVEALFSYGVRSAIVTFTTRSYGRDLPERREHAAMTRESADVWRVEHRVWGESVPACSLLLVSVPDDTFG